MEPTLPKSDSTTSLSSLISIGNESKNSGPSTETCIICLGDEPPMLSTLKEKSCTCSYHYHENCLRIWYDKHSSLCPICRKQNIVYVRSTEVYHLTFTLWQKIMCSAACMCVTFILIWSIATRG
jgi:hypothetical protein